MQRCIRSRESLAAAALVAATLGCGGPERPAIHAAGSILVQLEPDAAPPAAGAPSDSDPPIVALPVISEHHGALLRLPAPAGAEAALAAEAAARSPGVSFAEPVYLYRQSRTPGDPRFRDLWGLQKLRLPQAWSRTTGARSVVVAVVDDGVALDHPDLAPNLWVNPDEVPGNGEDDDQDGLIDDVNGADFVGTASGDPSPRGTGFHGSHVAGIIGAAGDNQVGVAGVNWKVSLMALRALGPQGGRSDEIARAIDYAVDHGARVINASWGGAGLSKALAQAIARAAGQGVLFVAAGGNDGAGGPEFPASLEEDNLLSVAATTPDDLLAGFSNRGAMLAAPGVGILSTTSPGRYERYDGTSMASAHVAGVAALLWAARPDATLAQVRGAMLESAAPVEGTQAGLVDADKALAALGTAAPGAKRLEVSREELRFRARPDRAPHAQTVALRLEGGGVEPWIATASAPWIEVSRSSGRTPSRPAIRAWPAGLSRGMHLGEVVFTDASGGKVTLPVSLEIGGLPPVVARGEGCAMRERVLHVRAGAGCALSAAEAESWSIRWRLPGGREVEGARLYAQFVRKGEYQVQISRDDGDPDPLAVVIE